MLSRQIYRLTMSVWIIIATGTKNWIVSSRHLLHYTPYALDSFGAHFLDTV